MNQTELENLVAHGESAQLEFKATTGQLRSGIKTVCSLLNGLGGYVLFGVADRGEIRGQDVSENTLEDISHELFKIEPPSFPDITTVNVGENRSVVVLQVPGGGGPFTYDGRAYLRSGATTRVMPQPIYERQLLEKMHVTPRWENQPAVGLDINALDEHEIIRTVEEAIRRQRLDDPNTRDLQELLTGFGLLEDSQLLNAAVVLFVRHEHVFPNYPQCSLRLARFRGTDRSEFIDNRQEHGNAFFLYQRAQQFLREHLPIAGKVVPNVIERVDDPLYPTVALREALANALCHRDYASPGGAISIGIYDDRLEISNTGAFPFDITIESLLQPHPSRPWNPLIAQVFYRRGLIESWGRGTLKMQEQLEEAGLPSPEFESHHGEVIVRLRHVRELVRSGEEAGQVTEQVSVQVAGQVTEQVAKQILEYCEQPRKASEIQDLIGLKHRATFLYNYLRPLQEKGWLAMTVPEKPRSRNQRYIRTDEANQWLRDQGE